MTFDMVAKFLKKLARIPVGRLDLVSTILDQLGDERGVEREYLYRDVSEQTLPTTSSIRGTDVILRRSFDWTLHDRGWCLGEEIALYAVGTAVETMRLRVATCLCDNEEEIRGETKLLRLQELDSAEVADVGIFEALIHEKKFKTLEELHKLYGISCLDFFGTILHDSGGRRYVPSLFRGNDGTWSPRFEWLGLVWNSERPSLVVSR